MGQVGKIHKRIEGTVGTLAIDRPDRANAYTTEMLQAMSDSLAELCDEPNLRAVLVMGEMPGWFCSGADLNEVKKRGVNEGIDLFSARVFNEIAACPVPTIAVIDGPAVGGGMELALACDIRLATARSHFAFPETALGLIPAAGGTFRLPQLIGPARAKEMILFGRRLDGIQAHGWGLVNRIVPKGEIRDLAIQMVEKLSTRDALAVQMAKRALDSGGASEEMAKIAQALLYSRQSGN
jgi:enoyl-CoA hydratase